MQKSLKRSVYTPNEWGQNKISWAIIITLFATPFQTCASTRDSFSSDDYSSTSGNQYLPPHPRTQCSYPFTVISIDVSWVNWYILLYRCCIGYYAYTLYAGWAYLNWVEERTVHQCPRREYVLPITIQTYGLFEYFISVIAIILLFLNYTLHNLCSRAQ